MDGRKTRLPAEPGNGKTSPLISVYIVTYRRHEMLRRAISSVLAQTHKRLLAKVINDDPQDAEVATIIEQFADQRLALFKPIEKRGATRSFNLVFDEQDAEFVALLEDDNWWDPTFLESQLEALMSHHEALLVVGNERIWQELPGNRWRNAGRTIWPEGGVKLYELRIQDICGSAKLCNSSMLIRVSGARSLKTPDTIPVDVTEHFRERQLSPRVLLNGKALVNYAETIHTARDTHNQTWGLYQCLLIGSIFIAMPNSTSRRDLAVLLWKDCAAPLSPRAVTLLASGVAIKEAQSLLWKSPLLSLVRFVAWIARRPARWVELRTILPRFSSELDYLVNAPLTRHFAQHPR